jgi:hypothetical protein
MSADQSFPERTLSIDSSDVVKLMLQYCKENHLLSTMQQMQKETGISLNTVDNIDHFINDIKQGKWDSVLNQLSTIKLPIGKLVSSISLFLVFYYLRGICSFFSCCPGIILSPLYYLLFLLDFPI